MTAFSKGDVVQVTDSSHEFFGAILIVLQSNESVYDTYCLNPSLENESDWLTPFWMVFGSEHLTKIGIAVVTPQMEEIISTINVKRSHPKIKEMRESIEIRMKWRHLIPGSAEAKAQGCICSEVRSSDCILHAFTVAEVQRAQRMIDG